jgi:hypothetical protein
MCEISWLADKLLASQKGLSPTQLLYDKRNII